MKGKIMRKHLVSLCFLLTVLILAAVMPVAVSAADTRPSVYAGEGDGIVLDGIREDSYGEPVEVSKAGVVHNADMPLTTAKLSVAWEGDTIYYYIEVNDITPNAKSSNFWQCDGVEFVVDLLDAKPLTYPDDGTVVRFRYPRRSR